MHADTLFGKCVWTNTFSFLNQTEDRPVCKHTCTITLLLLALSPLQKEFQGHGIQALILYHVFIFQLLVGILSFHTIKALFSVSYWLPRMSYRSSWSQTHWSQHQSACSIVSVFSAPIVRKCYFSTCIMFALQKLVLELNHVILLDYFYASRRRIYMFWSKEHCF